MTAMHEQQTHPQRSRVGLGNAETLIRHFDLPAQGESSVQYILLQVSTGLS